MLNIPLRNKMRKKEIEEKINVRDVMKGSKSDVVEGHKKDEWTI